MVLAIYLWWIWFPPIKRQHFLLFLFPLLVDGDYYLALGGWWLSLALFNTIF